MSTKIHKAIASLAKKDIGFRRSLLAALGAPLSGVSSPLRVKMASGMKVAGIVEDTMDAYADANVGLDLPYNHPTVQDAMVKRKIKWMGKKSLPLPNWVKLMEMAVPNGYNRFDAKRVGAFLTHVEKASNSRGKLRIFPAREYSVAAYVTGPKAALQMIVDSRNPASADEVFFDGRDDMVRMWWD